VIVAERATANNASAPARTWPSIQTKKSARIAEERADAPRVATPKSSRLEFLILDRHGVRRQTVTPERFRLGLSPMARSFSPPPYRWHVPIRRSRHQSSFPKSEDGFLQKTKIGPSNASMESGISATTLNRNSDRLRTSRPGERTGDDGRRAAVRNRVVWTADRD
jgi:hypothetical protein